MLRPTVVVVMDGVKGEVTVITPAWAGSGLGARAAYAQAAERVMDAVRDLDRAPAVASRDLGAGGRPSRCRTPRVPATWRWWSGEGVHPRRRHLPGGAEPALGAALRAAALRALPGAPPHQPVALHVLLRLRRLPAGRRQPGDPGAGQGRDGDASGRSPAPGRAARARRRTRASRRKRYGDSHCSVRLLGSVPCSPAPRPESARRARLQPVATGVTLDLHERREERGLRPPPGICARCSMSAR